MIKFKKFYIFVMFMLIIKITTDPHYNTIATILANFSMNMTYIFVLYTIQF